MTRLEKYKNILIPVDDVAYAEYRKPEKGSWDEEGGTYVKVRNGGVFNPIKLSKKNVLDDFKKWYDETMARIGPGNGNSTGWFTFGSTGEEPFDVSPRATWSTITVQHDGMEHPL